MQSGRQLRILPCVLGRLAVLSCQMYRSFSTTCFLFSDLTSCIYVFKTNNVTIYYCFVIFGLSGGVSRIAASCMIICRNVLFSVVNQAYFPVFGSVLDDERLSMYEDFANTFRGEKTLQACLIEDLKVSHCFLFWLNFLVLLMSVMRSLVNYHSPSKTKTFIVVMFFVGLPGVRCQSFPLHNFIHLQKSKCSRHMDFAFFIFFFFFGEGGWGTGEGDGHPLVVARVVNLFIYLFIYLFVYLYGFATVVIHDITSYKTCKNVEVTRET